MKNGKVRNFEEARRENLAVLLWFFWIWIWIWMKVI